MPEPFIGQIALFPYSFPPRGWADCAGQLMAIQQNKALFSLIGTTYGGDGKQYFGLPDLQGRAAVGPGTLTGGGTYALGQLAGVENVPVSQDMAGSHRHGLAATTSLGTSNDPAGGLLAQPAKGDLQGYARGKIYNPG